MFLIFRQTLHVFKPVRVASTIKGRVTMTSSSVTSRHLKRCSFQRSISTEKINHDQAEYSSQVVYSRRDVLHLQFDVRSQWRHQVSYIQNKITTEIYTEKNARSSWNLACIHAGMCYIQNMVYDKQFQCRCALLHNHTTFMCKSNHTNECNTITSEVVSMIITLSDLFRLNVKWVANRIADNLFKTLKKTIGTALCFVPERTHSSSHMYHVQFELYNEPYLTFICMETGSAL